MSSCGRPVGVPGKHSGSASNAHASVALRTADALRSPPIRNLHSAGPAIRIPGGQHTVLDPTPSIRRAQRGPCRERPTRGTPRRSPAWTMADPCTEWAEQNCSCPASCSRRRTSQVAVRFTAPTPTRRSPARPSCAHTRRFRAKPTWSSCRRGPKGGCYVDVAQPVPDVEQQGLHVLLGLGQKQPGGHATLRAGLGALRRPVLLAGDQVPARASSRAQGRSSTALARMASRTRLRATRYTE